MGSSESYLKTMIGRCTFKLKEKSCIVHLPKNVKCVTRIKISSIEDLREKVLTDSFLQMKDLMNVSIFLQKVKMVIA